MEQSQEMTGRGNAMGALTAGQPGATQPLRTEEMLIMCATAATGPVAEELREFM